MRHVRSRGVKWTFFAAYRRPPRRRGVPPEWKTIRLYRIFHSLKRTVVRLCGSGYRGRLRASRTATSFDDNNFDDNFAPFKRAMVSRDNSKRRADCIVNRSVRSVDE